MTSTKKRIAAALTAAILVTALAVPATATEAPTIRVGSYKGSILDAGERSGLIISPSGADYTVASSDPDTVAVDQVLTFLGRCRQGVGDSGDHRIQQCRGAWNCNADGQPNSPRSPGEFRQRG